MVEVKKIAPVLKSAPKKQPSEEEEHDEPEVSGLNIVHLNEMYIRFIITFYYTGFCRFFYNPITEWEVILYTLFTKGCF